MSEKRSCSTSSDDEDRQQALNRRRLIRHAIAPARPDIDDDDDLNFENKKRQAAVKRKRATVAVMVAPVAEGDLELSSEDDIIISEPAKAVSAEDREFSSMMAELAEDAETATMRRARAVPGRGFRGGRRGGMLHHALERERIEDATEEFCGQNEAYTKVVASRANKSSLVDAVAFQVAAVKASTGLEFVAMAEHAESAAAAAAGHHAGGEGVQKGAVDEGKPAQKFKFALHVKADGGLEQEFAVSMTTQMDKLITVFCKRILEHVKPDKVWFMYEGKRIKPTDTPESLGMQALLEEARAFGEKDEDFKVQVDAIVKA